MEKPIFLFAPGAGAPASHPWMRQWAKSLETIGAVATFDYPYMIERRRRPDPLPTLVAAHREALRQARAEQWLREGLAAAGLNEKELTATRGSDPRKIALAQLLWRRTTVSQGWLAERLAMRSAANVSQQLRRLGAKQINGKVPRGLASFVERAMRQD